MYIRLITKSLETLGLRIKYLQLRTRDVNVSSLAFAFIRSLSFSSGHWYTLEISYEQAPYGSIIHIIVDIIVDLISFVDIHVNFISYLHLMESI